MLKCNHQESTDVYTEFGDYSKFIEYALIPVKLMNVLSLNIIIKNYAKTIIVKLSVVV